ncbi:MAG: HU family DNA-binding protein [Rhodospirillaceae bacterium]|nr:HU family DNA-binding protein [Defluviicoccus sp.]MDE0616101.1 HU family DNA-binding protein [Rhodospirillaceae bacterium]
MNRKDIAARVADEAGIGKATAEAAVAAVFAAMTEALARGEDVSVAGFGRLSRKDRPARQGRNPATGEAMTIGPSSGASFKAAKALKDALNR